MSMEIKRFNEIDLNDCFFDSLKEDYPGFDTWYNKKATAKETAFIQKDGSGNLQGFLYMKNEDEALLDITPNMPEAKRLKVGTFKIDAHNTKLGERFVKKIVDKAIFDKVEEIYVTIFEKHEALIKLLEKYGFKKYGTKGEGATPELVFTKKMNTISGDLLSDFPLITTASIERVPLKVFQQINPLAVIIVKEKSEVIRERLQKRDGRTYNISQIETMQKEEIESAKDLCTHLKIQLFESSTENIHETIVFLQKQQFFTGS